MAVQRRSRWRLARGSHPALNRMEQEKDNVLDRFFGESSWLRRTGEASGGVPALAMLDQMEEVILRADLRGLGQTDIKVTLNQGVLTIRGEHKYERETSESGHRCGEGLGGIFRRGLAVPAGVDTEKVSATFKDGILEVHLPKTKEAKGKMIEIEVT